MNFVASSFLKEYNEGIYIRPLSNPYSLACRSTHIFLFSQIDYFLFLIVVPYILFHFLLHYIIL